MSAKKIIVKPISSQDAARIVKSCHYSGKVVPNSQLHFGVFLNGKCGGAMQFGPSMRKDLIQGLVRDTGWNGFIELNRMAFADWLPRNSESRAISVALRLIRKAYPHIEWVISFADSTQCGDGTIYRASGFVLTAIKKNTELVINPRTGETMATMAAYHKGYASEISKWEKLSGHMLRYIYFLNPAARERLTVPILPFTEIQRRGAGMYLGKPKRAGSDTKDTADFQSAKDGSTPIPALHSQPTSKP
jgi:hypothetical protein